MNFQDLLTKLQQIDQPTTGDQPTTEDAALECGMPGPSMTSTPDTPPPSMSINLNAQGLDNIEELMALIKAVNPSMDTPMSPSISVEPMKMLPMDIDHEDEREETDEWANTPDTDVKDADSVLIKGDDLHKAKKSFSGKPYRGDNPMAAGAYESKEQLRASIKEELSRRLSEAKGEKFDPLKHVKNPTAGEKKAAKDVKRGSYADRAAMLKSAETDGRLKD